MSFNTFGQNSKSVGALRQVWAEVTGVKSGGGTLSGFEELPVGAVIPAGTPVYLDRAGGALIAIHTFEVGVAAIAAATQYIVNGDVIPQVNSFVMKAGSGAAVKINSIIVNADGTIQLTLAATLGALAVGDILVESGAAGASGAVLATPNGLLWHDIVKEEGDTLATGAVVDRGRIYEDRINPIPASFKAVLPSIKFEKGI